MATYPQNGTSHAMHTTSSGDLNNISAMRATEKPLRDPEYAYRTLAVSANSEDSEFRNLYRPFLLDDTIQRTDWVSRLELATVVKMAEGDFNKTGERLKVLVLYGSLRTR
jgi:arsenical resistance protein ArsH